MPTVTETIQIGRISTYLAANDVASGALYGARVDPFLPILIAMETDSINWQNIFNPSDSTLQGTANYLYSICGAYALLAKSLLNIGGIVGGITSNFQYLIPVTGNQFTDSTHYDDARIVDKNLEIFFNDISRYLLQSEFSYTATGIQILLPGFDAVANPTYKLFIFIK